MPKVSRQDKIERWVLRNVEAHPRIIAAAAQRHFGVSRSYVNAILRDLVADGRLEAEGQTRAREYRLIAQEAVKRVSLDGSVPEDRAWREIVKPRMAGIGKHAKDRLHYCFTEMFNNALDHSGGTAVTVKTTVSPARAIVEVNDDGVGVFHKIRDELGLEDEEHAVLELSKGKLTTDPERHTGEGIFFTSRMCDTFFIRSGSLVFSHDSNLGDWLMETRPAVNGTKITLVIDPDVRKPARAVFDKYSTGEDYAFDVTHVPVSLAQLGEENLISRSQAKRLLARISSFRRVILDFRGVTTIGQAFADEIFRVFVRAHPEIELHAVRATPEVERMIRRAEGVATDPA